ncbi:hypothetical protein CDL15_Pgr027754 [Punica granatum]|uniref:Uncharacterized protein n=1 Tax=Punica granatum TaxID=22663 RepID=A0A218XJ47_PUNGR|nr:hypothetical protein CDL15_Pgr027754 [Punica granatum]PKI45953.1 hypothetical protein CRG98_033593 [Punica granatum]
MPKTPIAGGREGGLVAGIETPTPRIRRTLKLKILPIPVDGAITPAITLPIGVAGALFSIGVTGAFCGLDSFQINEKFDVVL